MSINNSYKRDKKYLKNFGTKACLKMSIMYDAKIDQKKMVCEHLK
jgi:hypothetical protein